MLLKRILRELFIAIIASIFISSIKFFFARIYTIISSNKIRQNSDYRVSISTHKQSEPVKFQLQIKCKETMQKYVKEVVVPPNTTKISSFQLGELNPAYSYRFYAESLSGMKIAHNESLQVDQKHLSIFIQTDKGIYKPGEKVRFRVIVFDNKLLPVRSDAEAPLNVYIKV